jgi:hypothetical protein
MRLVRLFSFFSLGLVVSLAAGCGRSDLVDELLVEPEPVPSVDASSTGDDGSSPDDATTPPPQDAQLQDAQPVPPEDVTAPPLPDAKPPPPDARPAGPCGRETCATGCCYGDICAQGNQTIACGTGGFACTDCTSLGSPEWECVQGFCYLP